VLTVLCCLLAGGGAWGLVLLERQLRARLDPPGPIGWALVIIGISLGILLATSLLYWLVSVMRTSGWLRAVALVWSIVGLIWIPTALAAAALSPGGGPGADLYGRLGEPQAGRWAAAALGLVVLIVVAGPASSRAIAIGRSWMRADALEFRRRLVRVVAGWPGAVAVGVLAVAGEWGRTPLAALWIVAVLGAFQLRTR
jgi:hypothetical protein